MGIVPRFMKAVSSFIVEPIWLDPAAFSKPIDLSAMFGNAHPVELEIGIGKGTFLFDQARTRPETNFIGIEYANWFARFAADRMRRAELKNVRVGRQEAGWFVRECIGAETIDVLHIYFPDPWPKERQKKRRLVRKEWMPEVLRILKPGGEIRVVTDHQNYFEEHIRPAIEASGMTLIGYNRPGSAREGETVGTNFERKYAREGRPFYPIAARKL